MFAQVGVCERSAKNTNMPFAKYAQLTYHLQTLSNKETKMVR